MIEFLKTYLAELKWGLTTILAILGAYIAYCTHRRNKREDKRKHKAFSVYIEQGFKSSDTKNNILNILLQIEVRNNSSQRITLVPSLLLEYKDNTQKERLYSLIYQKSQFDDKVSIDSSSRFDDTISLQGDDVVRGWVSFKVPNELANKRIDLHRICLMDNSEQAAYFDILLLKEIIYETRQK